MSIENKQFEHKSSEENPSQDKNPKIEQTRKRIAKILEGRVDQFLENPPKHPKREIADYVEQNGILVPERFQGLEQALDYVKSGGEVIVRSEHPQEYNGASGLLISYSINQEKINKGRQHCDKYGEVIDWEKMHKDISANVKRGVENQIFGQMETFSQPDFEEYLRKMAEKNTRRYCELLGLDFEDFNKIREKLKMIWWKNLKEFNKLKQKNVWF